MKNKDYELADLRSPAKIPTKRVVMTPFGVLGMLVLSVIIVLGLLAQIAATRISAENVELRKQYSNAVEEQSRLKLDFERAFDLTEIEREAKAIMGMRTATELQVVYIGAEPSDHVVILNGGTNNNGILGKISDILRRISEYL